MQAKYNYWCDKSLKNKFQKIHFPTPKGNTVCTSDCDLLIFILGLIFVCMKQPIQNYSSLVVKIKLNEVTRCKGSQLFVL